MGASTTEVQAPEPVGFLLIPEFSMMAFFSAVEPLRVANRCGGRRLYEWRIYSEDGTPVTASNGMTVLADQAIAEESSPSTLVVCSSFDHDRYATPRLLGWLRRLGARGATLGGLDTGCFLLAAAGLLNGHRVTLHWESIPAFRERYPDIQASGELYEIDGRRLSCAGGTSAMDMMLHLIARRHGPELAVAVSEQLIHDRIRHHSDHQRMALASRLGSHNEKLLRAVETMERHVEQPLPVGTVAERCSVSPRQLERLFAEHLGATPRDYYLRLRLSRARQLLQQTDMNVIAIGLACGFGSASSFSRAYRTQFRIAPSRDRSWL